MSQLEYVCISDLHLGAVYSVLTDIDDKGRVSPTKQSPTLVELAKSLRAFLPPITGDKKPTLVLLGDVLDLAFSPSKLAVLTFVEFMKALFPENQPDLFERKILYLPGNHDHREWQVVRDELFLEHVKHSEEGEITEPPICTGLFDEAKLQCRLLTALVQNVAHLSTHEVRVAYPNIGWKRGPNTIVLHHGHFVESMYRAVSEFEHWFEPYIPLTDDVNVLEHKNGSWIDFLWSSTGDQGHVSQDILTLFETMQDGGATRGFIKKLSDRIAESIGMIPVGKSSNWKYKDFSISPKGLIRAALDFVLARGFQSERTAFYTSLSPDNVKGLEWYLNGPVYRQITGKSYDPFATDPMVVKGETTFVFGHTHKPFEDRMVIAGYEKPVNIYNTGGWVLDSPNMSPTQGASLVFIDDEAHAASLRLYNDDPNDTIIPVSAKGSGGPSDLTNPMLKVLENALSAKPDQWNAFQKAFQQAAEERGKLVRKKFFNPTKDPVISNDRKTEEVSK